MKTFLISLISILLFGLWLLPFVAIVIFNGANDWSILYIPIALITGYWIIEVSNFIDPEE